MKSKQEVIQEAWGKVAFGWFDLDMKSWDENNEGWYARWQDTGKVFRNFLSDYSRRFLDCRDDVINLNGWFWPKVLDGIENNNGWTRIESEEDLPKESGKYWVIYKDCKYKESQAIFSKGKGWDCFLKVTHYQPIIKPEAPIY